MNEQRQELINRLAADLRPVQRPGRIGRAAAVWLIAGTIAAVLLIALLGPFRAGSANQLFSAPRFALEALLGALAVIVLCVNAFRAALPAPGGSHRWLLPATALLLLWLALMLVGLWSPALPPSMAGKRPHCLYETLLIGLPLLGAGLFALRRLWPLHGAASGLMIGLAAGLIPALVMQFACMYDPAHGLLAHILPGLAVGAVGSICGFFLLRR